jgi:hypothetical protein
LVLRCWVARYGLPVPRRCRRLGRASIGPLRSRGRTSRNIPAVDDAWDRSACRSRWLIWHVIRAVLQYHDYRLTDPSEFAQRDLVVLAELIS